MKSNEKASLSILKIICVTLILIFLLGIGVMAANTQLSNVKVILSNKYEVNILTSKTTVEEILKENNIVLLPDEKVVPNLEEQLDETRTIIITKKTDEVKKIEIAENVATLSSEEILKSYETIIEKIITEEVEIPFETITKDASSSSTNTTNKIIQSGKNGLKKVTYKVKYQNEQEIERTEISSEIIKEPVDKIVQVQTKYVTSRSGDRSSVTTYGNGTWSYSESDLDLLCAITAQECSASYEGALAVITTACNRTASSRWQSKGSDPLSQYKAKGQFCYSIDSHWKRRLNGNYPSYVKQAVLDALNGKRNHSYLSFRSAGYASGEYIGGNVYFNHM